MTHNETTVLVMDDDPGVRRLNARILRGLGHTVIESASPLSALAAAKAHGSDIRLVVSDVHMPDMSGPEVVRRLREMGLQFRALYSTAATREELERMALTRDPVLRKPYRPQQLMDAVAALLNHEESPRAEAC